jgi:hypothetical protein
MFTLIAVLAALVAGFGVGRIKNVSKLAAIKAELDAIESSASQEVKSVIASIRAHL